MTDYFIQENSLYRRLRDDYFNYDRIIIAYDIDDTVRPYKEYNTSCEKTKQLLKECKEVLNPYFIVFTANSDIDEVEKFLEQEELPYDKINENIDIIVYENNIKSKVFYTIFLYDKAGLKEAYEALNKLVTEVKSNERI